MRLVLASASPRRRDLLDAAGIVFDVAPVHLDEARRSGEAPHAYVERMACEKAAVASRRHPGRPVLAADTIVVVDREVLGKPADEADAARMLRQLSGRAHEVLTGVALTRGTKALSRVEATTVWMSAMAEEDIAWYVATGEPRDKAGAYAIQGLASRFVTRIEGAYGTVVGLPVAVVLHLWQEAGGRPAELAARTGA